MANAYEPRTDLADRLLQRTERGPKVGFGSALFRRLGIADPFAGGDITDRALTQPKLDFLSSRAYLAELRNADRHGDDADFKRYRETTSLLWPLPPGVYSRLPRAARDLLFFDRPAFR